MRTILAALLLTLAMPAFAEGWRLAGTVLQGEGMALIETGVRQQLVPSGQDLPPVPGQAGTCRLGAVAKRFVWLACRDGRYRLDLNESAGDTIKRNTRLIPGQDAHIPGSVFQLGRDELTRIAGDRQRLVSELPMEPVIAGEAVTGYRLLAVPPGGLASRAGFRADDVVRTVNGVDASSGHAFMAILNSLGETQQLQIGFERDGVVQHTLIILSTSLLQ